MGPRFKSGRRLKNQRSRDFADFFAGGAKLRPMIRRNSARFAVFEFEVQSEDFLEGGFFGGEVVQIHVRLTHPPVRAHDSSLKIANQRSSLNNSSPLPESIQEY